MDDEEVAGILQLDESAAAFLARTSAERFTCGIPEVDDNLQLRPGTVIEVIGGHATGKTSRLIQAAVHRLTSHTPTGMAPDQAQPGVIYFDLDGKFDFLHFLQVLTARLDAIHQAADPGLTQGHTGESRRSEALQSCLQNFQLVRCSSSWEYLLALLSLSALLPANPGCRLLLVDNVTAFLWPDRAAAKGPTGGGRAPLTPQRVHETAATLLRHLALQHRLAAVVSKHAAVDVESSPAARGRLVHREALPAGWQANVRGRLLLRWHNADNHSEGLQTEWETPSRQ